MEDLYLDHQRHAQDLRETWQARCLAEAKGRLAAMVLAVLMHSYPTAMQVLLRVVFPTAPVGKGGWVEVSPPFFWGPATILAGGAVVCKTIQKDRSTVQNGLVYGSEEFLIKEMRDLADRLKLDDGDRNEMTESFKRWIVRDMRTLIRPMTVPEARAAQREIDEINAGHA